MNGILGTWNLLANVKQAIYYNSYETASVVIANLCNKGGSVAYVSIAVSSSATNIDDKEWIVWRQGVNPNNTFERMSIMVGVGKYLVVRSTSADVNAICYGVTNSTVAPAGIATNYGTAPAWSTSTTLPTIYAGDASTSIQLAATDEEEETVTYSVTSGSLPTGLSLSSTGLITGTPTATGYSLGIPDTSSTVGISATDSRSNSTPRTFNITKRWADGTSSLLAAPNALTIKTLTGTSTNGYYWIKPAGASTAYQVHCDMSTNGGGWMLMSFCGINIANGAHVENAYTGAAFNMGSTATSITSTNQSSGTAGNMGQDFINSLVVAGRGRGMGVFRIEDAGTTWINWYIPVNTTANWLPIIQRQGEKGAPNAPAGNLWLKNSYTTYTADTGNNGAGTPGGTLNTYGGSDWGTAPFNMITGSATNWGYSISPNYPVAGGAYSTYQSAHSSGWNRRASFWLKIA